MSGNTIDSNDLLELNDEIMENIAKEEKLEALSAEIEETKGALEMYQNLYNELQEEIDNWDHFECHYNSELEKVETLESVTELQDFTRDDVERVEQELLLLENEREALEAS